MKLYCTWPQLLLHSEKLALFTNKLLAELAGLIRDVLDKKSRDISQLPKRD